MMTTPTQATPPDNTHVSWPAATPTPTTTPAAVGRDQAALVSNDPATEMTYVQESFLDVSVGTKTIFELLDDSSAIVLNIGGYLHRTLLTTLLSKPHTRLSRLAVKHLNLGREFETEREYFYDRNPDVFSSIMDYYRTGRRVLTLLRLAAL